MEASLLVELLTEELPPKSLRLLSQTFASALVASLDKDGFRSNRDPIEVFATPRRLAMRVPGALERSADRTREVQGPSVSAPAQAVAGFAKKNGVPVEALERLATPKGEVFLARVTTPGQPLADVLAPLVEAALKALPIPKVMRWGDGEAQFVRPVHGLVMLHGTRVVPGNVLGLESGNRTRGHRFMGAGEIVLAGADQYEAVMMDQGKVVADFAKRRAAIEAALQAEAGRQNAALGPYEDLLDEVTALVEHPSVYAGKFDAAFLSVPQECLILTMRQNQKYFPLFDPAGKLLPKFLIVSNMDLADPKHIIAGNQRVVRPRLEDARFFFQQDLKTRLETRVPELGKVVYHNKLGTQLARVERLQLLAGAIARLLGADALLAERAAWLAKADLLTGMVGEFPELQGVMGRYYAMNDGEPAAVADAIEAHYRPRYAGDALPEGPIACAVALADKLDAMAGLFSIGQHPSGDRDPFGLRRAALGVVRILVERQLAVALPELVSAAFAPFEKRAPDELIAFVNDRFAGYLKDLGYSTLQVEAVLSRGAAHPSRVPNQLEAVKAFQTLPEAESLAAANKRIGNILKQAKPIASAFDTALLAQDEEKALALAYAQRQPDIEAAYARHDYTGALKMLAAFKAPVDAFFDKVMVMDKDERLRDNRIALLASLHATMNRIADLSKLAA